jgi:flagellar biosynthesis/type III secretory pathway chaperone
MSASTAQQLGALLQQQTQGAAQLLQILQSENDALVKRDVENIQRLSQQKSELSAALEQLAQQQHLLLQELGLPNSAAGLNSFISSLTQNLAAQLRNKQQQLQSLLESCQRLNMVNGNIIAANRYSAETALAILRGQFGSNNLVYSAGGQAVTTPSSKPLIKA